MTYRTDLNFCKELIKSGSHSFYAASKLLPAKVRNPALILYAFCRLADDAIDDSSFKQKSLLKLLPKRIRIKW